MTVPIGNTIVSGELFHYKFSTAKYERIASPIMPVIIRTVRFKVLILSLKIL
jgi:hypothetical protein